jgi:hypothetical protein
VAVYTASVILPKDAVVVRLFDEADAPDAAQVHLTEKALPERPRIQSRRDQQSLDISADQEHVAGGMTAAVGAANTGESKPVVVEGDFPIPFSFDRSFE